MCRRGQTFQLLVHSWFPMHGQFKVLLFALKNVASYICKGATSAVGKDETGQKWIISRSGGFHRRGNQLRFWWESIAFVDC